MSFIGTLNRYNRRRVAKGLRPVDECLRVVDEEPTPEPIKEEEPKEPRGIATKDDEDYF